MKHALDLFSSIMKLLWRYLQLFSKSSSSANTSNDVVASKYVCYSRKAWFRKLTPWYGFVACRKRRKREDMVHTCWNPKKQILLMSLLLWDEIVAIQSFVWSLVCACGQAVSEWVMQPQVMQPQVMQPQVWVLVIQHQALKCFRFNLIQKQPSCKKSVRPPRKPLWKKMWNQWWRLRNGCDGRLIVDNDN